MAVFRREASVGPLNGVRVLDLTHVLNGPFCTMLLATMGADVIKVEQKEGDRYRRAWMPVDAKHDGYGFLSVNSNKRGITLNLKSKRGKELFLDLLRQSDVLVENFSPGAMDRLGLGTPVAAATATPGHTPMSGRMPRATSR
jgi:crotonobetainyl-CoA:carnitine CoA-transferase CaiB-like acyl-CoA transferase